MTNQLKLCAAFDRELVWVGGGSYRYLLAEVEAPTLSRPQAERPPLHVALVIDRSGSMGGERLESAKRAATAVAKRLRPEDRFSVVCFDDVVDVVLESERMSERGAEVASARIAEIESRGTTNLSDGWLAGAECLAGSMKDGNALQCRVIVLSDGKANRGIVDPRQLAAHAAELRQRGIVTSAVGIGEGYSTRQLEAIAEHGGGILHDAEFADEIAEMVMGELEETLETFADELIVELEAPAGVRVECWSGFDLRQSMGRYECSLGALPSSRKRSVLFCTQVPRGREGELLPFSASARWRSPGETEFSETESVTLALRYVSGPENSAQEREVELSLQVARIWQARLMRAASDLNRERDYEGVRRLIGAELQHFERFCKDLPGGRKLVRDSSRLQRLSERAVSERLRKNMNYTGYQQQKGTTDYKRRGRGDWTDGLRE